MQLRHRIRLAGVIIAGIGVHVVPGVPVPATDDIDRSVPALRLSVPGDLLRSWLTAETLQTAAVDSVILESPVEGTQSTQVRTSVRLKEGSSPARFDLLFDGDIRSETVSRRPDAEIRGVGRHAFRLQKPVVLDDARGIQLLTGPAHGQVEARSDPRSIRTPLSNSPLFGPLAEQVAWTEVLRRGEEINQATVEDVASVTVRAVDAEVDQALAQINRQISELTAQLSSLPVTWTELSAWRTGVRGQRLIVEATREKDPDVPVGARALIRARDEEIEVSLHSELLTAWLRHFLETAGDFTATEGLRPSGSVTVGRASAGDLSAHSGAPGVLHRAWRPVISGLNDPLWQQAEISGTAPPVISCGEGRIRCSLRFRPTAGIPGERWFQCECVFRGQGAGPVTWKMALESVSVDVVDTVGQGIDSPGIVTQMAQRAAESMIRSRLERLCDRELSRLVSAQIFNEERRLLLSRVVARDGMLSTFWVSRDEADE